MTLTLPESIREAMIRALTTRPADRYTLRQVCEATDPRTRWTPALQLIAERLHRALTQPNQRLIIAMPPQEGKALALDTPIPTPTGWTTMGELAAGDEVLGRDGRPCRVTWVSPTWTGRDCYAVTTGDGDRIIADAAHEWAVRLDRRRGERIVETTTLAKARSKNAQITATSLDLPAADLPMDPYALGAWLGDGHTNAPRITTHPADQAILDRIQAAGYPVRAVGSSKFTWTLAEGSQCSTFRKHLVAAGVWGDKHIPAQYLRASRAQRLALLQGLVDTDGHVTSKGQVEFVAARRRLAEDVRELVYTLGAKATLHVGRATIDGRDCGEKYRVRFYLADAAYLPRKAARCKDSSVASVRYVTAEPCESVPTRCIEVDSPDHMFLAGRSMLPTHNSTLTSMNFPVWALMQNPELRIVTGSYAQALANRNGRAVRNHIKAHPEFGLEIARDNGAASEWTLQGHRGGLLAVGRGAGVVGRPADLLIVDDPLKDRKEADSPTVRQTVIDWWTDALANRLSPDASAIVMATRWHENDLSGWLAAQGGWEVLNIPAQCEDPATDPLGRKAGEFMQSAQGRTQEGWELRKAEAGPRAWASLFQGHPAPAEGALFKREWWQWYNDAPTLDGQIIQSWDLSFKGGEASDWVVGQVWMRRGAEAYLLDQVRGQWGFADTVQQVRRLSAKWPQAIAKLIEDKANGPAVIDSLKRELPGIIPVNPQGGKEARASAVEPMLAAGNVYLPSPPVAPWVRELVEEAAGFPNGAHDDQVDALTQALTFLFMPHKGRTTTAAFRLG